MDLDSSIVIVRLYEIFIIHHHQTRPRTNFHFSCAYSVCHSGLALSFLLHGVDYRGCRQVEIEVDVVQVHSAHRAGLAIGVR